MKKLLGILVLGFIFCNVALEKAKAVSKEISAAYADDIRDFQIEGMSIGDSALDYFSEAHLENNEQDWYKNKEYSTSSFPGKGIYDYFQISYKSEDDNYTIEALVGGLEKKNYDNKECNKELDTVALDISELFANTHQGTKQSYKHGADTSGKSTVTSTSFNFLDGGAIIVACYNMDKATNQSDSFRTDIRSNAFNNFLEKAYITKEEEDKNLDDLQPSESRFEAIIRFFKESMENKIPIDPDATALKFGYKSFEEFVEVYFRIMEITNLSVNDVREFIRGTDETVIIDQSQENLDKLYSLIMNDKIFRKENTYLKTFKKGKYDGNKISMMGLAVYLNYEKEMAKITRNPNLKKISPFTWGWGYTWGTGTNPYKYALPDCREDAKKYKLFGGECIIVDSRSKITGEIKNMLKPNLELAKRMEEIKKQKLKIKKEYAEKVIAKAKEKEKIKEPTIPIDLVIPVQVYIIQVNKSGYITTTTAEEVTNDFKKANSIWNTKGIQLELININNVEGNSKSIVKDLKWGREKYAKSLKIDKIKGAMKTNMKNKFKRVLFKFIKATSNRNRKAINLFYIPYFPAEFHCGLAYSYSLVADHRTDNFKRQNKGLVIIAEQHSLGCGSTGEVVAHEIGHMFSLFHKETANVDLMMWGTGEKIRDWQSDKLRKYHKKYLKRTLALN